MNRLLQVILLSFLLCSCSSMNRQKVYSGMAGILIGGAIGGILGEELTPNESSERFNKTIGATLGGGVGYLLGSKLGETFWKENPDNMQLDHMILDDSNSKTVSSASPQIPIQTLEPKNIQKIKLRSELPSFLKGKVKEANVLTYELDEYIEQTEDGRTIYHTPHKAYEYILE